jgi:hypothetical protein
MYCWAETDVNCIKECGGDFYILLNTEWCVELRTYGCQHVMGTMTGSSSRTLNLKLEETELKLISGARVCPNAEFPWSPWGTVSQRLLEARIFCTFWQAIFALPNMKINSVLERVHKLRKKVSKFLYEMWVSRPGELNAIGVKKPIFWVWTSLSWGLCTSP